MFYITAVLHLSYYLGSDQFLWHNMYGNSLTWSCLGTFSFISGYLLAKKYCCDSTKQVLYFYKKRLLRFYPLFIISTICLYLIGFNDIKQSIYGLLGLAPFVSFPPYTLWYISMMMVFYLLSPIVLIRDNKKRIIRSVLLLSIFVVLSRFIHIDLRFIFNLLVYLLGVCATGFEKSLPTLTKTRGMILKALIIGLYILAFLNMGAINNVFLLRKIVDILGIFVLFIVASLIKMDRCEKIIYKISYLSMSFYLFHRLTYWLFLEIYKPQNETVFLLYLILTVPIGMFMSFYIQKSYDIVMSVKKSKS